MAVISGSQFGGIDEGEDGNSGQRRDR
jgi:hypothetical protein